ncbi:4'-phosphopantetheinyl transferase [Streptomyces sp. HB132]|uniref:4'-phosphopantetheinyl transferase family protein n=1 Tax=Streptomyces sp. HB132 TaxID=767388 RepID=UPI0019621C48|nr:4'-phosphopantetheinyl transferase superfamily protein [Streptomyces sp. HB132]MBM7442715.1 4'-phosphopantetheinyl transferase EntD [Streptomyces sp. HB132]
MIEKLLPPSVAVAETYGDPPHAPFLHGELEVVSGAVEGRRREFAAVRWCARRALADLGIGPAAILPGERGSPVWPDGVVGSMTHCDGYRGAAVGQVPGVLALGIDAEPHLPLPEGVLNITALPAEQRRITDMGGLAPEICWDRLLFSMKEAVYKAWFPLTRRWLGFEQADITIGHDGTFSAHLLADDPAVPSDGFAGRWLVEEGLMVTAVAVTAQRH